MGRPLHLGTVSISYPVLHVSYPVWSETLKAVSYIPAADSLKKVTDRILPDVCCDDSGFAAAPWLQSNHGVGGG